MRAEAQGAFIKSGLESYLTLRLNRTSSNKLMSIPQLIRISGGASARTLQHPNEEVVD
jgi:hypothetical protein